MNFLKPPTDNLYKFMAISGLILLGYSAYFYEVTISNLTVNIIEQKAKGKLLEIESRKVKRKLSKIKENQSVDQLLFDCMDHNENKFKNNKKELFDFCFSTHKKTRGNVVERHNAISEIIAKSLPMHEELEKKRIIFEKEIEIIDFNQSQLNRFIIIIAIFVFWGLCLFFGGAYLWLTRVQIPQDRLLEKELNASELDENDTEGFTLKRSLHKKN